MNILSWNCPGMGNPRSVRMLLDLVSRFKPNLVFLMETIVNKRKVESVQHQIRYDGLFTVDGVNNGEV